MTKDVLITIAGLQIDLNEDEPVEVLSVGEYYYRNGKHYALYDEYMSDEQYDGREICKNTIKITDNQIEIVKKGPVNVHMIFELGKKNISFYSTPFGEISIGIYTTSMEVHESEGEIKAKLNYSLDMNNSHVSDCYITVSINPR